MGYMRIFVFPLSSSIQMQGIHCLDIILSFDLTGHKIGATHSIVKKTQIRVNSVPAFSTNVNRYEFPNRYVVFTHTDSEFLFILVNCHTFNFTGASNGAYSTAISVNHSSDVASTDKDGGYKQHGLSFLLCTYQASVVFCALTAGATRSTQPLHCYNAPKKNDL
jgi:hypothetical protein